MNFASLPDRRANLDPNGPAVSDGTRSLTNAGLLDRVRAARRHLQELGVGAGDVVALKLRNRVEFVVLLFACWRLSATVTPVNPTLTEAEVGRQLAASSVRLLVVEDEVSAPGGVATMAVGSLYAKGPGWEGPPLVDPSALALLIFTSGTTGVPKGVMLDHANLDAMAEVGRQALGVGPADRCLLILPLFHVNGIVVSVLAPLLAGGRATIAGRFDPRTFFGIVEKVRPTMFSAVPTIYGMLAALPAEVTPDTSSVRYAVCGAAPMPVELIRQFELRYGIPIIEGYGLSEGTCASTSNPLNGERKPGTVGVALPGVEVAIMDGTGALAPDGTAGEVVVKGPTVMRGYLNRPEETAKTIIDGWLHTGDIGLLDHDGYLKLVDRAKDMIIRGGENIYPKEIESVIYTHPSVLEAAVVGRPDAVYGEVPVAFVSARRDAAVTPDELLAHMRGSLAKYKLPEVVLVDEVPKNPVGKFDKPALRRRFVASAN
jgi:long-chain acyl-CoA synthetase